MLWTTFVFADVVNVLYYILTNVYTNIVYKEKHCIHTIWMNWMRLHWTHFARLFFDHLSNKTHQNTSVYIELSNDILKLFEIFISKFFYYQNYLLFWDRLAFAIFFRANKLIFNLLKATKTNSHPSQYTIKLCIGLYVCLFIIFVTKHGLDFEHIVILLIESSSFSYK